MSRSQMVGVGTAYQEIQRRIAYLAPLFAYLRAHYLIPGRLVAEASARVGSPISSVVLSQMKRGERVIPPWFVEQCCRALNQSTAVVMGAEWVERFGADGRGGCEPAPVGEPRTYTRATAAGVVVAGSESAHVA